MNYRLMTPGPVPVPEAVLASLARPVLHHRTPEFEAILARVLKRLPQIFLTKQRAFIHASTGSGAMESAIVNCLSPGDHVLAICAGKFGQRWADIAEIFGMKVSRLEIPWGQDLDPSQVQQKLKVHSDIRAILCQACETSTGAWLPIKDLAVLTRESDKIILIVDAITGLGAVPMPMDEWGLDVVIGGSQKALMLPTGLSFIAFSPKAWKFVEAARSPRYYWDVRTEKKANEKNQTHFSSAVTLICALDKVLDEFETRGLSHFHSRVAQLSRATQKATACLGLKMFPQTSSPSLSCIELPAHIDGQKIRSSMEKDFGVTVMGGQDQLTGRVIRIGHMGNIHNEDVLASIEALAKALQMQDAKQISASQMAEAQTEAQKVLNT